MTAHMDAVGVTTGTVSCNPDMLFDLLRRFPGVLHPVAVIEPYAVANGEVPDAPVFRTALYVVCDETSRVLYVGQCCRQVGGVNDRLAGHDALNVGGRNSTADHVYVVPLADQVPHATVSTMEAALIAVFHPPYNVQRVIGRAS